MLVNSVSGIRFTSAEDVLSRPGAYAKSPEIANFTAPAEKKSSKTKKVLIGALVLAAALTAGAAAARHFAADTFKILGADELAKAGIMQKAAHYTATAGEWILTQGSDFTKWAGNLFKSKAA